MATDPVFTTRIMYAPSIELIQLAARQGYTHVIIGSTGHAGGHVVDNCPVLLPDYPRYVETHPEHPAYVAAEQQRLRDRIAIAKSLGLKTILHSYEPSSPYGFKQVYPELFEREISSYYETGGPAVQKNRQFCVARDEVQAFIRAKTAELIAALPELDALSYTNNETNTSTKVWHRCDRCADRSFADNMQSLHEALEAGVHQAGTGATLMYRAWGSHDADNHYYQSYVAAEKIRLHELPGEDWIPAFNRAFAPENLNFKPSRDVPEFQPFLRQNPSPVIYKASWADTNLHHPLNPFLGTYKPADEICELSVEFCRDSPKMFYIMGRENQRRARLCRDKGVRGIAVVPICWGMQEVWSETVGHPSEWLLGDANLSVLAALMDDPDVSLETVLHDYLRERYGQDMPDALVQIMLDSEDVAADGMNINEVRATGDTFKKFFTSIQRYGTLRGDYDTRLKPSAENIAAICAHKDAAIVRAAAMLDTIDSVRDQIPARAYREFRICFEDLHMRTVQRRRDHERLMTAYGLLTGDLESGTYRLLNLCQLAPPREPLLGAIPAK